MQHPILWISDTSSAVLCAQFEKSQTKRTTFLCKKSSPTHESPFNFKISQGKVTNFSEVTKFFPDFFFPDKVCEKFVDKYSETKK